MKVKERKGKEMKKMEGKAEKVAQFKENISLGHISGY